MPPVAVARRDVRRCLAHGVAVFRGVFSVLSRAATLGGAVHSRTASAMATVDQGKDVEAATMSAQEEFNRKNVAAWAERKAKEQAEIQAKRDQDAELAAFWAERRERECPEYTDAEIQVAFAKTFEALFRIDQDRDQVRSRSGESVTATDPNTRQHGRQRLRTALEPFPHLPEWHGKSIPGIADGAPSPVGLMREGAEQAAPRHDVVGRNGALALIQKLNEDKMVLDLTFGDVFDWPSYLRSSRPLQVGASKLLQGRGTPGPRQCRGRRSGAVLGASSGVVRQSHHALLRSLG